MNEMSPSELLMQEAWDRLWVKGTDYYLPNIILNGIEDDHVVVQSIDKLALQNVPEIPLYSNEVWGHVSLQVNNLTVGGLSTIQNKGFQYSSSTTQFHANVSFENITFCGNYIVNASGIIMCAIDALSAFRGIKKTALLEAQDDKLDQARLYRTKLINNGGAGPDLVNSYYEHNDTMNEIVKGPNSFSKYWGTLKTSGIGPDGKTTVILTSKDLSDQTYAASRDPDNSNNKVGYAAYNSHGLTMQTLFNKSCQESYNKTLDSKYTDAANAAMQFQGGTQQSYQSNRDGQTVTNVMNTVQNNSANSKSTSYLDESYYKEAIERAEQLHEEYMSSVEAGVFQEDELKDSPTPLQGNFSYSFPLDLSMDGTVTVSGNPPNLQLTSTISKFIAIIPGIPLNLQPDVGELFIETDAFLKSPNAAFVESLLAKKVNDALKDINVLKYFSERVNQSIDKIFG